MKFISLLWFAAICLSIASSVQGVARLYRKNVAGRTKYGAPQGFWLSIRNRGFWKDEHGWHNE